MKRAKIVLVLTSIIAIVFIMSGCNNAKPSSQIKNITFMGWGSTNEKEICTKMIKDFEKANTDVRVKYVVTSSSEYYLKLSSMMQANTEPDIFYYHPEMLMPWVDAGKIVNVKDYLAKSKFFDKNNIWKSALDRYRYDGKTIGVGEDIYGIPKDLGPWVMVYNKNLFKERGVAFPDAKKPWTWDEFVDACKKLTYTNNDGKKVFGLGHYMLEIATWSNGGDFLDESKTKVTVDTKEFSDAMQWIADLRNVNGVMPTIQEDSSQNTYTRWLDGSVAIFGMGPWDCGTYWKLPFEWDIAPFPVSPKTGKEVSQCGSAAYGISVNSKYKDEAYKLAEWFAFDPNGQADFYKLGEAVPNLMNMAQNEYLKFEKGPANKQEFLTVIKDTGRRFSYEYTYNREWYDEFFANATKVWEGQQKAADYCKSIQPKMQELLDKAIKQREQNKK